MNGTAAMHVALKLAGVQPGDEVLVPALTFVATANAVAHCGAVPHFVDSDSRTLGSTRGRCSSYLEAIRGPTAGGGSQPSDRPPHRGRRPDAYLRTPGGPGTPAATSAGPLTCRWSRTQRSRSAASFGARHTGTFGTLAVLSFNGNKIVTTGGGGAILTNDERARAARKALTTTAKRAHRWEFFHDQVALQLSAAEPQRGARVRAARTASASLLSRKRTLAMRYRDAVAAVGELRFVDEPEGCRSNFWLNTVVTARAILRPCATACWRPPTTTAS